MFLHLCLYHLLVFMLAQSLNTPTQGGAKMLRMPILLSKAVNNCELRGFGKQICQLMFSRNMESFDQLSLYLFSHKMTVYLYVAILVCPWIDSTDAQCRWCLVVRIKNRSFPTNLLYLVTSCNSSPLFWIICSSDP